jgi:hypothetical protein
MCSRKYPLPAPISQTRAPDFRLQEIANGVWAAIANDEGLAGGNAGFVIGDDGVAVIDTFQDPVPAKAMLDAIRKLTPLPIRFVVNTHYHLDHVNGNDVFAAAGAAIVAHPAVRAWMRTENIKMLDPPVTPEKNARVASLTLPTVVYNSRIDLYLGTKPGPLVSQAMDGWDLLAARKFEPMPPPLRPQACEAEYGGLVRS